MTTWTPAATGATDWTPVAGITSAWAGLEGLATEDGASLLTEAAIALQLDLAAPGWTPVA